MPLLPFEALPAPAGPVRLLRPPLLPAGPPLIYSNNPEPITLYPDGGVLYESGGPLTGGAAARPLGSFRAFYHHLNATGRPFRLAVVVTNVAPWPVTLIQERVGGPYLGWAGAGALALRDFLAGEGPRGVLAVVPPGGRAAAVDVPVPPGQVVTGLGDFTVVITPETAADRARVARGAGDPGVPAPAAVSFITYAGELPPHALLPALPLHPLARPYANPPTLSSGPVRATFPHSRRLAAAAVPLAGAEPVLLQVAARVRSADSPVQPDGPPLPGEYELGTAWADGAVPVYVNGNYGVDYTFDLTLIGAEQGPALMWLMAGCPNLFCPRGTPLVVAVGGNAAVCATPDPVSVWPYAGVDVRPGPVRFTLRTGIPGGSCAPARHWAVPG